MGNVGRADPRLRAESLFARIPARETDDGEKRLLRAGEEPNGTNTGSYTSRSFMIYSILGWNFGAKREVPQVLVMVLLPAKVLEALGFLSEH